MQHNQHNSQNLNRAQLQALLAELNPADYLIIGESGCTLYCETLSSYGLNIVPLTAFANKWIQQSSAFIRCYSPQWLSRRLALPMREILAEHRQVAYNCSTLNPLPLLSSIAINSADHAKTMVEHIGCIIVTQGLGITCVSNIQPLLNRLAYVNAWEQEHKMGLSIIEVHKLIYTNRDD